MRASILTHVGTHGALSLSLNLNLSAWNGRRRRCCVSRRLSCIANSDGIFLGPAGNWIDFAIAIAIALCVCVSAFNWQRKRVGVRLFGKQPCATAATTTTTTADISDQMSTFRNLLSTAAAALNATAVQSNSLSPSFVGQINAATIIERLSNWTRAHTQCCTCPGRN